MCISSGYHSKSDHLFNRCIEDSSTAGSHINICKLNSTSTTLTNASVKLLDRTTTPIISHYQVNMKASASTLCVNLVASVLHPPYSAVFTLYFPLNVE